MSGSTSNKKTQQYYCIHIETPSVVFPRRPSVNAEKQGNAEHRFHSNAKDKFADFIKNVVPKLDTYIETLIAMENNKYQISEYKKSAVVLDNQNRNRLDKSGVTKCCVNFVDIGKISNIFSFVSMELTFAGIPSEEAIAEIDKGLRYFFAKHKKA